MPFGEKRRRRDSPTSTGDDGHGQQSLDIGPRPRQANDFCIHNLLARQFCLAEQPPNRRIEPEQSARDFFQYRHKPVSSSDVNEFMASNTPLLLFIKGEER